jgi:hypothetical protein
VNYKRKYGSALSELRNFGGMGLNPPPPKPHPSVRHCQLAKHSNWIVRKKNSRFVWLDMGFHIAMRIHSFTSCIFCCADLRWAGDARNQQHYSKGNSKVGNSRNACVCVYAHKRALYISSSVLCAVPQLKWLVANPSQCQGFPPSTVPQFCRIMPLMLHINLFMQHRCHVILVNDSVTKW